MLTEEEAKKKWCPFARMAVLDSGPMVAGFNRRNDSGWDDCGGVNCIASECMAWRFKPHEWKHKAHGGDWIDTQETDGYGRKGEKLPTVGYCGLAGSP